MKKKANLCHGECYNLESKFDILKLTARDMKEEGNWCCKRGRYTQERENKLKSS